MALLLEIGVRSGRISVVLEFGRPNATTRKVSLVAAPSHIIFLLALCQIFTIIRVLVQRADIWLVYSALLVAVVFFFRKGLFIGERWSSASLLVKSRGSSPKQDLFAHDLSPRKVRDLCINSLKSVLLTVVAEGNTGVYHQVSISASTLT